MPRQPRLILPGVALHIIQRGNNRGACFVDESDYRLYLLHLRELAFKLECRVHAYCLMTNHVHLLLTPVSSDACVALMRDLGQRYVQYFNRRHHRTGTLWEGRFRSCVAESASYALACYRYIELNPVRASMVDHLRTTRGRATLEIRERGMTHCSRLIRSIRRWGRPQLRGTRLIGRCLMTY